MKAILVFVGLLAVAGSVTTTSASERTVTLRVMHMTCAICHITVRKAIESIPGVALVTVSTDDGTATVVFNDVATNPVELAEAVVNAGYPAWPINQ